MYRQSDKKLVEQQYVLQMSHNMVHFGPLVAEVGLPVWGTQANFNGFRVLAVLLHGSQAVSIKLCSVEQRAPPMFGRVTITLGIGPHFQLMTMNRANISTIELTEQSKLPDSDSKCRGRLTRDCGLGGRLSADSRGQAYALKCIKIQRQ